MPNVNNSVYNNPMFIVASGATADMKKLKQALFKMFCFEFSVNQFTDKEAILSARSYTNDPETEARKPFVIKAAKDIAQKYNFQINIADSEEYIQSVKFETEKKVDDSEIDAIFGRDSGQMGGM